MEQGDAISYKMKASYSSFTKFKQLPPELRIKIWQYAMPGPRTVIVESPFLNTRIQTTRSLEDALWRTSSREAQADTWRSQTEIPALLHASAEARHEALKHYQLSLGSGTAQPRIYIDFSCDTPFFGHAELKPECLALWASTKDLQKIRQLAIVSEGAWRVMHWQTVGLKALEKIIFVHGADDLRLGPQQQLVEDTPYDSLDMELDIYTQEQRLLEEGAGVAERLQEEEENAQGTDTSLESAMMGYKPNPIKKRIQAAREELEILMQVLPTQWDREPMVSTAIFREGPGNN